MWKPERLSAFCDGVIAIAITLLVLGLEVPSAQTVPDKKLAEYLLGVAHPLLGYLISFVLIGSYWLQHYEIFHYVVRVNRPFVALNGLFLFTVSFVPFPTGLQAAYRQDEMAMVIYAGSQFACGISLLAIWLYAAKGHRLIEATASPELIRGMSWRIAVTPIVSVGAILMSFINIDLGRPLFLAIPAACLIHRMSGTQHSEPPEESGS